MKGGGRMWSGCDGAEAVSVHVMAGSRPREAICDSEGAFEYLVPVACLNWNFWRQVWAWCWCLDVRKKLGMELDPASLPACCLSIAVVRSGPLNDPESSVPKIVPKICCIFEMLDRY